MALDILEIRFHHVPLLSRNVPARCQSQALRPCCRCGTLGHLRSWWSALDREHPWFHKRTPSSPITSRMLSTLRKWNNQMKKKSTYDKTGIDSLQDLFLDENHGFAFTFLYPFLFQLLTGVHLASGPDLARTNFAKASFTQNSIHSEGFVRHRLTRKQRQRPLL